MKRSDYIAMLARTVKQGAKPIVSESGGLQTSLAPPSVGPATSVPIPHRDQVTVTDEVCPITGDKVRTIRPKRGFRKEDFTDKRI